MKVWAPSGTFKRRISGTVTGSQLCVARGSPRLLRALGGQTLTSDDRREPPFLAFGFWFTGPRQKEKPEILLCRYLGEKEGS